MALTWAVGWGLSVGALASVSFLFLGNRTFFWDTVRPVTALAALSGFVGGAVFSLVLGAGYRRRMLGDLRAGRMALCSMQYPPPHIGCALCWTNTLQRCMVGLGLRLRAKAV